MCCLKYENDYYEARAQLPDVGDEIHTRKVLDKL